MTLSTILFAPRCLRFLLRVPALRCITPPFGWNECAIGLCLFLESSHSLNGIHQVGNRALKCPVVGPTIWQLASQPFTCSEFFIPPFIPFLFGSQEFATNKNHEAEFLCFCEYVGFQEFADYPKVTECILRLRVVKHQRFASKSPTCLLPTNYFYTASYNLKKLEKGPWMHPPSYFSPNYRLQLVRSPPDSHLHSWRVQCWPSVRHPSTLIRGPCLSRRCSSSDRHSPHLGSGRLVGAIDAVSLT